MTELRTAADFNQRKLKFCTPAQARHVIAHPDFVPVAQYGGGMLPLRAEFGFVGDTRYLSTGLTTEVKG